mmetsp:Transcript_93534/g.166393  ORF Transcript_93534/g.166393 Transcript_93534/m.166393 type:complete len:180 (-) Transcript_93534:240-779(-)|eukprot:CAMPEP_0197654018 /NCGR_PEP_ID=MMETSP1338-20131121/38335_1 /TAXON_ID=43686 ORGANISM="Pelagodinium beii, Strain RCC1491" /NCGR_SAMPLE_ID=MMETSP1338 /ASSEMBLY_ACC=CAM_ASM_000754 /LENGTH=179 /DNA_ID=CAMNT_0043229381 /DNA_START=70 /DNA_END=609 /DNA_ORIENTATION=+
MAADQLAVEQQQDFFDEMDEELIDLPEKEKQADPLRHAKIQREVDGKTFFGQVQDIEQGRTTGDRLYRIVYDDGDLEHLTPTQVKQLRVLDDAAMEEEEEEDAEEDEEQEEVVSKKPAARATKEPKAKAKAKAKAKGKAKAAPKVKAKAKPKAKATAKPAKAKAKAKAKPVAKKPAGKR